MPQIPYSPLPEVRNTGAGGQQFNLNVNADMFGANVGRATAGLGAGLDKIGDVFFNEAVRMKQFKEQGDIIELERWNTQYLQDGVNNLTGDGSEFPKAWKGAFDERANALRQQAPNNKALDLKIRQLEAQSFNKVHGVALKQMDGFYKTQLDDQSNKILNDIQQNPTEQNAQKSLEQINSQIDKSGMGAAAKEAYKAYVKGRIDLTQVYGKAQNDPAAVLEAAGTGGGYMDKIANKESGNDAIGKHPGSSAWGRYGITAGTWTAIANSPEGKRLGLDPSPEARKSDANQKIGARILTNINGASLTSAGFEANEKNLYLAHFMGAGGATKLLKALNGNAGADASEMFPEAAKANPTIFYVGNQRGGERLPRSVQEVYNVVTRGMGGRTPAMEGTDARLNNLSPENRQAVVGFATRVQNAKTAEEGAIESAKYADMMNNAGLQIRAGTIGQAEVDQMVRNGIVTDMADIKKLEGWVSSYQGQQDTLASAMRKLGDPNANWNPYLGEDKKMANALAEQTDKMLPEGAERNKQYVQIADRTGVIPDALTAQFKQSMNSSNPQMVARSADIISMLLASKPESMSGPDGETMKQFAADMNGLTTLYGSREAAAARYAERHQKTAKGEYRFDNATVEAKEKAITKDVFTSGKDILISAGLTGRYKMFGAADIPNNVAQLASQDYMNEYAYKVKQGANDAEADNYAKERIKQGYGEFGGKLMKAPPQKAGYPLDPNGKLNYLDSDVMKTAARNVPGQVSKFELIPNETTYIDQKMGRPARYDVNVMYKLPNGLEMHDRLMGWSMTPEQIDRHMTDTRAQRKRDERGEVLPADVEKELQQSGLPSGGVDPVQMAKDRTQVNQAAKEKTVVADEEKRATMERNIKRLGSRNPVVQ